MTIPQIISLAIITSIVALSFRKGTDLFSPAKIFLLVWSSCIILVEFKFSGYQHNWSPFSWFVLLLGLTSLLLGFFISYVIFLGKPFIAIKRIRDKARIVTEYDLQKLFYIIFILFVLYISSFIAEVIIEGNVPIFSPRLDRAKAEFGVFGLHLIVNFQLIIMFLVVEYAILTRGKKIKKIIIWSIFLITIVSFALLLQRFNFFMGGVMILALLYYASRALRFRRIVVLILIFFGFLSVIGSIRLSQYVSQYIYTISKMKFSRQYAIFSEPYMYISMNLENMASAVEKLEHFTYSAMSFDWLFALFGIKHWMIDYFNINTRPFLISTYNTYPFHWYYFYDFGIFGVFFLPLLSGFIIGIIYYKMRLAAQLKWVVLYSICLALMVISFFTNPLTMLNFIANFVILWLIHHFFIEQKSYVKS